MSNPRLREALFYERQGDTIHCLTCEKHCRITEGKSGFCATRVHMEGHLFTLVYGDVSSLSVNPIEKKPFFHFYPGSKALTIGSWSCNFTCPWCQNYEISASHKKIGQGHYISPEAFIQLMKSYACQGTSISFNEPTLIVEYSLDVFTRAKQEGFYNTYVTNGYMTPEVLESLIASGLDAMNIDIKGGAETVKNFCGADVEKVWRNAFLAKEKGVWIELTTLVIPGINDSPDELSSIARRIKSELGDETPWHVTAYYPAYKFRDISCPPPTSVEILECARTIGIAEGLRYVYIGNIPGHPGEHTYCPRCGMVVIERYGLSVVTCHMTGEKRCPGCGEDISLIGEPRVGWCIL